MSSASESTPAAGFGHSMGGAALLMAEERRPGTFDRLFLFEPIVFPDDFRLTAPNMMSDLARSRRSTFPSRDDALARYASRPPLNTMRADVLKAYVDDGFVDLPDGSVRLACLPDDEARTFESESKVHTSNVAGRRVGGDRRRRPRRGRSQPGPTRRRAGRHPAPRRTGHADASSATSDRSRIQSLVAADIRSQLGKIRRDA